MTFKNLLLQNYWANFNQLGIMHLWVKWIQVCSNVNHTLTPRGDNSNIHVVQNTLMTFEKSSEQLPQFQPDDTEHLG